MGVALPSPARRGGASHQQARFICDFDSVLRENGGRVKRLPTPSNEQKTLLALRQPTRKRTLSAREGVQLQSLHEAENEVKSWHGFMRRIVALHGAEAREGRAKARPEISPSKLRYAWRAQRRESDVLANRPVADERGGEDGLRELGNYEARLNADLVYVRLRNGARALGAGEGNDSGEWEHSSREFPRRW